MYQLRLQLEKYLVKIVYIKGIHKTVADVISQREYDPSVNQTAKSYFMTKSIRTQNAVRDKTGNNLKTMVQFISKHQQT
jgi:hypothetical protein